MTDDELRARMAELGTPAPDFASVVDEPRRRVRWRTAPLVVGATAIAAAAGLLLWCRAAAPREPTYAVGVPDLYEGDRIARSILAIPTEKP
jgi:anti-sigma factor RsiW